MSRYDQAMKMRTEQAGRAKTLPATPAVNMPPRARARTRAATHDGWKLAQGLVAVLPGLSSEKATELAMVLRICSDCGCQIVDLDTSNSVPASGPVGGATGVTALKIVRGDLAEDEWAGNIRPLLVPFKESVRTLLAWVAQGYAYLQPDCLDGQWIAVIPDARESWRGAFVVYSVEEYLSLRDVPAEFAAVHVVKKELGGRVIVDVSQVALPGVMDVAFSETQKIAGISEVTPL